MNDEEKKKLVEQLKSSLPVVLVIDDDEWTLNAIRTTLTFENIIAFGASDGVDALRKIPLIRDLDLILLDLQMPKLNGLEMLEVYEEYLRPKYDVPILVMTAGTTLMKRYEVLKKPFNIDDLLRAVRKFTVKK